MERVDLKDEKFSDFTLVLKLLTPKTFSKYMKLIEWKPYHERDKKIVDKVIDKMTGYRYQTDLSEKIRHNLWELKKETEEEFASYQKRIDNLEHNVNLVLANCGLCEAMVKKTEINRKLHEPYLHISKGRCRVYCKECGEILEYDPSYSKDSINYMRKYLFEKTGKNYEEVIV